MPDPMSPDEGHAQNVNVDTKDVVHNESTTKPVPFETEFPSRGVAVSTVLMNKTQPIKSRKYRWWMLPLFCTLLSCILIPMPDVVDAVNRGIGNRALSELSTMETVTFQMSLPCEACAFRIRSKILSHFETVENVRCTINDGDELGQVIVQFDGDHVTKQQIFDYILDKIVKAKDRKHFRMLTDT